ncbi:MAG: sugar ABC transporter ATP-binding protein [Anaerolineae bacterium]|nr:sugar ABC transporter ATP-binding protein [Anaerolineae bacterium]
MDEEGKMATPPPVSLSAEHIVKHFGGVVALADGNLDVQSGEVLALLGANGSGKSTLSKVITGVLEPNGGELVLDGEVVNFTSPQAAQKRGIAAVYQELSLIPDMTVAENIWLGHEPLKWGVRIDGQAVRKRTQELLALFEGTVQESLRPEEPVSALPPDERQVVEILKVLSLNPRLIILDEATASLDSRQVRRLFELISSWKEAGKAIIFVSHRMEEIFRVADRAVILRNGKSKGAEVIAETTEQQLVNLMIGDVAAVPRQLAHDPVPPDAAVRLQLEEVYTDVLRGVSLSLKDGELLGLGGLQGQGQTNLLRAVFGDIPFFGTIAVSGELVRFSQPRQAMRHGVAYVPGDRGSEGLLLSRSILENFQLPSWRRYGFPLRMERAKQDANRVADTLSLVRSSLEASAQNLSGGNAQKVVIGKWLLRQPQLLLLNDPTKGVDVGTKREFYNLLAELRRAGTAILFYSSDDEELLGLCDRVLVLHDGKVSAELSGERLTRSDLVTASMGAAQDNDRVPDREVAA